VPRLPSLRGIAKSKSAVIPVWNLKELGCDADKVGLSGSFTKVVKIFYPQRNRQARIFQGDLGNQVGCLVDELRSAGLI